LADQILPGAQRRDHLHLQRTLVFLKQDQASDKVERIDDQVAQQQPRDQPAPIQLGQLGEEQPPQDHHKGRYVVKAVAQLQAHIPVHG
jgi:hypothetical protein